LSVEESKGSIVRLRREFMNSGRRKVDGRGLPEGLPLLLLASNNMPRL
jgi:hypothetical protein